MKVESLHDVPQRKWLLALVGVGIAGMLALAVYLGFRSHDDETVDDFVVKGKVEDLLVKKRKAITGCLTETRTESEAPIRLEIGVDPDGTITGVSASGCNKACACIIGLLEGTRLQTERKKRPTVVVHHLFVAPKRFELPPGL